MKPTGIASFATMTALALGAATACIGCGSAAQAGAGTPVLAFAAEGAYAGALPAATGGVFGAAAACTVRGQAEVADADVRFPGGTGTRPVPLLARLDDQRSLFVWTEGSLATGLHVHARTLGGAGETIGSPIDLGNQGSALGRPEFTVDAAGRGTLTFVESNGHGFQRVAVPLDCGGGV